FVQFPLEKGSRKVYNYSTSQKSALCGFLTCAQEAKQLLVLRGDLKDGAMFCQQAKQASRGRDFCEASAEQKVVTKSSPGHHK
ncbi:MAG: hypothetical protein AAB428_02995, partial [Patescibacteria group bacterium]